jgi:hypothetical protein
MAAHDQLSHASSDGSNLGDRAARAGFYTYPLGENIAAGYTSVRDIVLAWMWCALRATSCECLCSTDAIMHLQAAGCPAADAAFQTG